MVAGPLDIALAVGGALEALHVAYSVGGSVASALSGEPRTTLDVDVVVALSDADVDGLADALEREFYVDREAVRRAVRQHASVNIIHQTSGIKVDLFIAGNGPLDHQQLRRRRRVEIAAGRPGHLFVHTPEDILLQKLLWYRLGGEVSDRQWRDVLGIMLVQGQALDLTYVRESAHELGIADLLDRALVDRGRRST
jgi:hypothetical protein